MVVRPKVLRSLHFGPSRDNSRRVAEGGGGKVHRTGRREKFLLSCRGGEKKNRSPARRGKEYPTIFRGNPLDLRPLHLTSR